MTSSSSFPLETQLAAIRRLIDERLEALVPAPDVEPKRLHQSIRHSLLAPGKRIRPVFAILVAVNLGGQRKLAVDPACAIEMVHTASLILDDLPIMDDGTLRRGRPANHRLFGEATATLAAVALLNRAYGVIAEAPGLSDKQRTELVALLSSSIGSEGIIAGQECDLSGDQSLFDTQNLLQMHGQKTGALFVAAAEAGARVAGVTGASLQAVRDFAEHLGLAFQIRDDVLDALGTETIAGKNVSQDDDKATFVSVMGAERAIELVNRYVDAATRALEPLGPQVEALRQLAESLSSNDAQAGLSYQLESASIRR